VTKLKDFFFIDRSIIFHAPILSSSSDQIIFFYKFEMPPGRNQKVTAKMMEVMAELGIALRI
jgi:hypothetical protein